MKSLRLEDFMYKIDFKKYLIYRKTRFQEYKTFIEIGFIRKIKKHCMDKPIRFAY
jgi:hypothetical protein